MNFSENPRIDCTGTNMVLPSASIAVEETLSPEEWGDFLKILTTYRLKGVSRNSSNTQIGRDGTILKRKETTAEHIYSSMKLAWYFMENESEFSSLDKIKVFALLLFHDDIEIKTEDTSIDDEKGRANKEQLELDSLPSLIAEYPKCLGKDLESFDAEYRENNTPEAKFAHAIDKMDALIHELQYPEDWGPKGFGEEKVRLLFQKSFEYSPTFMKYFETLVNYLRENNYFDENIDR